MSLVMQDKCNIEIFLSPDHMCYIFKLQSQPHIKGVSPFNPGVFFFNPGVLAIWLYGFVVTFLSYHHVI